MKRTLTTLLLTLSLLFGLALWYAKPGTPAQAAMQATYPLNPASFTSLGVSPFTSAGTYTINASKNNAAPILTKPDNTTINGVFFNSSGGEIAVFTFDSINIPANVTVQGVRNANSRPIALLSKSSITIAGVVDVSGNDSGGAGVGGNAGPGGGGGGGGNTGSSAAAGGLGFVNGNPGSGDNGGNGGSVAAGGGGGGGVIGNNERGPFGTGGGGGGFGGPGLSYILFNVTNPGGIAYGNLATTLQGGSGGGGASHLNIGPNPPGANNGGGGGGAVEIGASNDINITGRIRANGGSGVAASPDALEAGGGAGGGIVLHAANVDFSGAQEVSARGGGGNAGAGGGRIHVAGGTISEGCANVNGGYSVGGTGVYTFSGTRVFRLNFDQQPANGSPLIPFNPVVKVSVRNGCGPTTDSLASVTLALGNNPTGATLGGTLTKQVVNGVATFDDLTVSKNGTGYTLVASSSGLSSLTSNAFDMACQTVTLSATEFFDATVGTSYGSGVFAAPSGNYNFSVTAGIFPPGLALSSLGSLGNIDGIPALSGIFNFTITATHINGCSGNRSYQLNVTCPSFTAGTPTATGTLNTGYSSSAAASPAAPSGFKYQYSLANGTSLPGGLTLNPTTGAITGMPAVSGDFSFAIKAELLTTGNAATGCSNTQTRNITISCPSFTAGTPASTGTVGANYSSSAAASPAAPGGFNYHYSLGNNTTLPPGLTLDTNTGGITGTPIVSGTLNFDLKVELFNSGNVSTGCSNTQTRSITVACPSFTAGIPTVSAVLGSSYSSSAVASPAAPAGFSYRYALASGQLPGGLTLDANSGAITGTPNAVGNFTFDLKAELFNSSNTSTGCSSTQTRSINVACPSFTIAAPAAAAAVGSNYSSSVAASPAAPAGHSYRYSLASGTALPGGLTLDANSGNITGIATASGSFSFSLKAELFNPSGNSTGCSNTQTRSINVACPSFVIGVPAASAALGVSYSGSVAAGPIAPAGFNYRYSLANATALPLGLALDANTGAITGTPTVLGTFGFDLKVELLSPGNNATGCSLTQQRSITVSCQIISLGTISGTGTVGVGYNQTVSATPAGAFTFLVTSGALPMGLSLNAATGAITGAPTQAGSFNFAITASVGACSGSRNYTVTIGCSAITLAALGSAMVGINYTGNVAASPSGAYSYSLLTGGFPSGLTINAATGAVTGMPTSAGTYSFTIKAQAANGCSGQQNYSLAVGCPSISLSALPLPSLNTAYSQTVAASPAGGSYSYAVTLGALPAGLSLNPATGLVSGTPTTAGAYNFTISVTGFGSCTSNRVYTGTIAGSSCPTITLPDLPTGQPGQLYSNSVSASPSGSYSYTVTTGSLPPGLTLYGSFGLIFGYPTTAGSYSFTITATGGNSCTGEHAYTVVIGAGAARAGATVANDFDGDGKSDLAVWRGTTSEWLIVRSSDDQLQTVKWGASYDPYRDVMVAADYDGDGKTDIAVFRRGNGYWVIRQSPNGQILEVPWGLGSDVPVPSDYDGDGKADIAVWRGAESNWYIRRSSDGQMDTIYWGLSSAPYNDIAVPGDYDGDGKTDAAVFRTSTGHWLIKRSSDGVVVDKHWGVGSDVPVPADYDGDGKTDIAVWRGADTNWYIVRSSDGATQIASWGTSSLGDIPLPGDYDGDGKTDAAVWRASEQAWHIKGSRDGRVINISQGSRGDVPVALKSEP